MYDKINEFFKDNELTEYESVDRKGFTVKKKKPLIWLDLLHYLGLHRNTARPYIKGQYDSESNSFSSLLAWAREIIEADLECGGLEGTYNERVAMLSLQANYRWSVEKKLTIDNTLNLTADEATRSLKELMQEVQALITIEQ